MGRRARGVRGTLVSKIPQIMKTLEFTPRDLVERGVTQDVAYRAARGEVSFHLITLVQIADALEVSSFNDLITYFPPASKQGEQ